MNLMDPSTGSSVACRSLLECTCHLLKISTLHLQIEGVKPEQEKAQLIAEAPMRQSNEEMMKVLESARRTFFVETGRPTLDSNPANVSHHVSLSVFRVEGCFNGTGEESGPFVEIAMRTLLE
jgi:hypothetical protein